MARFDFNPAPCLALFPSTEEALMSDSSESVALELLRVNRSTFGFLLIALPLLSASTAHAQTAAYDSNVTAHITLAQLGPPHEETLPPPENERCASYARAAVSDYATMRQSRRCLVADSPRWQADYRKHYQWCLTARPEWVTGEWKARDKQLVQCGVRKSY
jgi:hypothetical protein